MPALPARPFPALVSAMALGVTLALGASPVPDADAASAVRFTTFVADPSGKDERTNAKINREKIAIKNTGRTSVTLTGWTVR